MPSNVTAALPNAPFLDEAGYVVPVWRAFFQALYTRTGGSIGSVVPPDLSDTLAAETAAREAGDATLQANITAEASTRAAADAALSTAITSEAQARQAADQVLSAGVHSGTTTNDNAVAGNVGEFISRTIPTPGVSLTTNVAANVTSISLTAGDWDVWGSVATDPAGTTTTQAVWSWVSTVSATVPVTGSGAYAVLNGVAIGAGSPQVQPTGTTRLSLGATTTVYLGILCDFLVSTMTAGGFIGARRVR